MAANRGNRTNHRRGPSHHRWRDDGIDPSSHGYRRVRVGKSHPLADPNGYAYEHHLIWVAAGGQILPGYNIHHLNEVRTDNRIENLALMRAGDHARLHTKGKPRRKSHGRAE